MAPDREVFCCVCGVVFDFVRTLNPGELDEDMESQMSIVYDARILSASQLTWISDYRVMGKPYSRDPLTVNNSLDSGLFISGRANWHYATGHSWDMLVPGPPAYMIGIACYCPDDYCFPIHSACLSLLRTFTQREDSGVATASPLTVADFVNACESRIDYSNKLYTGVRRREQRDEAPPPLMSHGGLQWSHFYFGAQRFWSDPWDCVPGEEWFCTNPLCEPQPLIFSPDIFHSWILRSSIILSLCQVIFSAIASYLPLRSALNFHATSPTVSSRLPPLDTLFWRARTLRLHGDWLWELQSLAKNPLGGNWKALLQVLTTARQDILAGAKPFWGAFRTERPKYWDPYEANRAIQRDLDGLFPPIPSGLKNRYRIWMCLECVSMDGPQRSLHGLQDEELLDDAVGLAEPPSR